MREKIRLKTFRLESQVHTFIWLAGLQSVLLAISNLTAYLLGSTQQLSCITLATTQWCVVTNSNIQITFTCFFMHTLKPFNMSNIQTSMHRIAFKADPISTRQEFHLLKGSQQRQRLYEHKLSHTHGTASRCPVKPSNYSTGSSH